jgi:hypothetical protein
MNKKFSKKALSEIVSITLLLLVAILAFLTLQNWYFNYVNNNIQTIPDQRSLDLEVLSINSTEILIKNPNYANFELNQIHINGLSCNVTQSLPPNYILSINITDCRFNAEKGIEAISLQTSSEIFVDKAIVKETIFNVNCDSSNLPGDWALVPEDSELGTEEFCVMKHEARWNGSGSIHSSAANYCGNGNDLGANSCPTGGSIGVTSLNGPKRPLANVNQLEARALCENMGEGFSLITNTQWMTLARNIQFVDSNWVGGSFGVGAIKKGNVGVVTSSSYNGANPEVTTSNTKARLFLDNGEDIWHLSGNNWEWINDSVNCSATGGQPCSGLPQDGTTGVDEYFNFADITSYGQFSAIELLPFNVSWDRFTNGIGNLRVDTNGTPAPSEGSMPLVFGIIRGGAYHTNSNENGGIFTINFDNSPLHSTPVISFRCTYTP